MPKNKTKTSKITTFFQIFLMSGFAVLLIFVGFISEKIVSSHTDKGILGSLSGEPGALICHLNTEFKILIVVISLLLLLLLIGHWAYMRKRNKLEGLLVEDEKKLSQIIQGSPIAILVMDKDHKITYWNKSFEKLTGVKEKDILGAKGAGRIFYGKERPTMADLIVDGASSTEFSMYYGGNFRKSLTVEDGYESESFFPNINEKGKWVYFLSAPIKSSDGKIIGAIESAQDITERKMIEERMRKSEENYRTIFNSTNDTIFLLDIESGKIIDVNKKVVEMFGYNKEECEGETLDHLSEGVTPHTHEDAMRWIRKTAEEGPQVFEWRAKRKDGKAFWVEISLKFVVIADRFRVLAIVRDIEKYKNTEQDMKNAKEYAELLFKIVPNAIFMVNKNKIITSWNKKAEEIMGYTAEEMVGKNCCIFASVDCDKECVLFSGGEFKPVINKECAITAKDGRHINIIKNVEALRDDEGNIIGGIESFYDITDRKNVEKELREELEKCKKMVEGQR